MSGRTFLDTNILVYCFDETHPQKSAIANRVVQTALVSGSAVISFQVVQEFFNLAFRKFAPPFTAEDATKYFAVVLRPMLAVHSSPALYSEAFGILARYRLSWYDSVIAAAATVGRCDTLLSEDMQNGLEIGFLQIQNPFAPDAAQRKRKAKRSRTV